MSLLDFGRMRKPLILRRALCSARTCNLMIRSHVVRLAEPIERTTSALELDPQADFKPGLNGAAISPIGSVLGWGFSHFLSKVIVTRVSQTRCGLLCCWRRGCSVRGGDWLRRESLVSMQSVRQRCLRLGKCYEAINCARVRSRENTL
jgi:hypothetical protein